MTDPPPSDPADGMAAGARQLAKDLLDELDNPASPQRLAERARKEREDAEALQRFYRATGQRPATAAEAARELAEVIDRTPAKGPFEPIEIPIAGPGGRKAELRFAHSPTRPQEKRYLELRVYTPSGISNSAQWLLSGSNAELAAYLRAAGTLAEMEGTALELVESLERNRLA